MLIGLKKIKYLFSVSIILLIFQGCMHRFHKDGDEVLRLDVAYTLKDKLSFHITESHIKLEKYYLDYIRVLKPDKNCNSAYISYLDIKGGLDTSPVIMWSYSPNLDKEKIDVLHDILYGFIGKAKQLEQNKLYILEIGIKEMKMKGKKFPRKGHYRGRFYINTKGKIVFADTYKEINKICKKFNF